MNEQKRKELERGRSVYASKDIIGTVRPMSAGRVQGVNLFTSMEHAKSVQNLRFVTARQGYYAKQATTDGIRRGQHVNNAPRLYMIAMLV